MKLILQDLRFASRSLRKTPGLTLAVLLSLAIGIGANTAVFSVTDALLLRPLPYPDPGRLAILWLRSPGLNIPQDWPSPGQYFDIKTQNHVFDDTAIAIGEDFNLGGLQNPERIEGIRASSSLLRVLGATPALGRTLVPDEDVPGKAPVAILTDGLWKRVFGADPGILGRSITLNGKQYTVAGVLSPAFVLNHEVMPTVNGIDKVDIVVPLPMGAKEQHDLNNENFNIVARLKAGVTTRQAQADIDVIAHRIRERDKRDPTFTISVVPLLEQVVGNVRRVVLVLLGSVALVLLIACANVANLLLSRATAREKELAIRTALGAARHRVLGQLLTESMLLGALGGLAGLGLAFLGLYAVRVLNPGNIPRIDDIRIDGPVLIFTLALSILTGIAFGLAPAMRVSTIDVHTTLKAGGRGSIGAGGFDLSRHRMRGLLVISQLGLSLMLLIGAGLLIRSFQRLMGVSPGFDPSHLVSMHVFAAGPARFKDDKVVAQFYEQLGERIARLPGVTAEGAVSTLPFTPSVGWGGISVEGYTPPPNQPELQVDMRFATPDYFRAMRIPLEEGRWFMAADASDSPKVVLVDRAFARHFWPHESAVGKRVGGDSKGRWRTIVGVVGVVKQYGLEIEPRMVVYFPHTQITSNAMWVVARTTSNPAAMSAAVVRQVHELDPGVPVYDVATMDQRLYTSLARQRFSMLMLGAFAGFALILAGVGVYGVMSYLVSQATRDIGVRMALGAGQQNILALIVRQGMSMALPGIAIGVAGALALTRVMSSLLFGISATDALTFSIVPLFLAVVASVATYIPARRATRVDPMVALRYE